MALPIEAGYLIDSLTKVPQVRGATPHDRRGRACRQARGARPLGRRGRRRRGGGPSSCSPAIARGGSSPPGSPGPRPRAGAERPGAPRRGDRPGGQPDRGRPADLPALPGVRREARRLLTVDRVIVRAAEKAELRRCTRRGSGRHGDLAVAALARERSLRFLSVRVISDDAADELPPEVARLLTRSGSYRVGVAMRAIWHRPRPSRTSGRCTRGPWKPPTAWPNASSVFWRSCRRGRAQRRFSPRRRARFAIGAGPWARAGSQNPWRSM